MQVTSDVGSGGAEHGQWGNQDGNQVTDQHLQVRGRSRFRTWHSALLTLGINRNCLFFFFFSRAYTDTVISMVTQSYQSTSTISKMKDTAIFLISVNCVTNQYYNKSVVVLQRCPGLQIFFFFFPLIEKTCFFGTGQLICESYHNLNICIYNWGMILFLPYHAAPISSNLADQIAILGTNICRKD